MGSGRTLRKHSHTRPVKTPGEKRRRNNAQRARLVRFGMDEAVVAKMQPEEVRQLVQRPVKVKKLLAPKVEKPAKPVKIAKPVVEAAPAVVKKAPKAAKPAAPKAPKAAAKPKAPKAAAKPKAPKAAKKAE
jgi:hypothetical protein